jgi:hypothetical protein
MMDLATLVAVLAGTFAILAAMISLFLWLRAEANADRRGFHEVQREDRKDLLQITRNLEIILLGIQQEMKDFHNRLCIIEEKKIK